MQNLRSCCSFNHTYMIEWIWTYGKCIEMWICLSPDGRRGTPPGMYNAICKPIFFSCIVQPKQICNFSAALFSFPYRPSCQPAFFGIIPRIWRRREVTEYSILLELHQHYYELQPRSLFTEPTLHTLLLTHLHRHRPKWNLSNISNPRKINKSGTRLLKTIIQL